MMNEPLEPKDPLVADLCRFRLTPPSTALRNQVLEAAQKAWDDAPARAESSRRLPLLRLAACGLAATLLIVTANLADGRSATNRQSRALHVTFPQPDTLQSAYPQLPAWSVSRRVPPEQKTSQSIVGHIQRVERLLHNARSLHPSSPDDPLPRSGSSRATSACRWVATFRPVHCRKGSV